MQNWKIRIVLLGKLYVEYFSGRYYDPLAFDEIINNTGLEKIDKNRILANLRYLSINEYITKIVFQGSIRTDLFLITPKGTDFCETLSKGELESLRESGNAEIKRIAEFLLNELRTGV